MCKKDRGIWSFRAWNLTSRMFSKIVNLFVRIIAVPKTIKDLYILSFKGLRECNICGKLGTSECRECFEATHLLSSTMFCDACSNQVSQLPTYALYLANYLSWFNYHQFHSHVKRSHHKPLPVGSVVECSLRSDMVVGSGWADKFREKLELSAIICSKEFHRISFVRTGLTSTAPWMFFSTCGLGD